MPTISWTYLRPMFVGLCILSLLSIAVVACGGKLFPKCNEPGVNCPPCRGDESWPDTCASISKDAGAESGK